MPIVNSDILVWARETAGLSIEAAARKLDLRPNRTTTAAAKLAAFESGAAEPSRSLVLRMAKQYRRPLVAFYLSQRPLKGNRGQDFRTLPADYSAADDALVDTLIRTVRARQSIVRAALEDEDDAHPLAFVGSRAMADGVPATLATLRDVVQLPLEDFRAEPDPERAFVLLRSRVEAAGVYVLLIGDLGSHHSAIQLESFRGFALADPIAPFIVINDKDAAEAWSFTLLHELCHLCLGDTGVSAARGDSAVERFCNTIASEFLLSSAEVATFPVPAAATLPALRTSIGEFAGPRNVSRTMVAYRLYLDGRIPAVQWHALRASFREEWTRNRALARERASEREGGPNYYVVRRHRLGSALLELVGRLLANGAITTTKAGLVLGVRPQNVAPLIRMPMDRGRAA
jgi:Zn-dependent peptidase ImmA (M78 family)